jgi:hypothetical protein
MQAFCRDFSGTENHVLICVRLLYNCSRSCLNVIQQQMPAMQSFDQSSTCAEKKLFSFFWKRPTKLPSLYIHQKVPVPLYVLY